MVTTTINPGEIVVINHLTLIAVTTAIRWPLLSPVSSQAGTARALVRQGSRDHSTGPQMWALNNSLPDTWLIYGLSMVYICIIYDIWLIYPKKTLETYPWHDLRKYLCGLLQKNTVTSATLDSKDCDIVIYRRNSYPCNVQ